jgi:hypothetical protein
VAGGAREMKGKDAGPDVVAWLAARRVPRKHDERAPGELRVVVSLARAPSFARVRESGGEADLGADCGDDLVG